ncbi:MAG: RpiB/LacA/LacB family sugar-phosphate isomerase [Candidatus Shapirobacteria bacterium]|nr:RpiB/LacA/LacB family sugar-phosphate isomerase [Candidatus Shapirobacteria bacterium]MDD4410092.1 RpiB/LacA/LacB family sugar-phosphate isomerase [Candidatus Shapirobacteria bacterium]
MSLIYVGADHRGFNLKKKIVEYLRGMDYEIKDLGANIYDKDDDYNEISVELAEKVVRENTKGILLCGSGVGVCLAANKVLGTRAALCTSQKQARLAREDSDANILCLATDLVSEEDNLEVAKTFLETVFSSEERFIRRINKIKEYEKAKLG